MRLVAPQDVEERARENVSCGDAVHAVFGHWVRQCRDEDAQVEIGHESQAAAIARVAALLRLVPNSPL